MTNDTSTLNIRPPLWLPILVVLIGGCFYLYGKQMERWATVESPLVISVSAEATVNAAPDIATLSFGVNTGRKTSAKIATDELGTTMKKVIAAAKASGIDEKDIATENIWLNPEYDYTPTGQVPRGYQASQSLRVKVRNLDAVGSVLSAVTAAGANQVGGVSFEIDDVEKVQATARTKAIENAKKKAADLAQSLGRSLGRMTGFSEGGQLRGMPVPMMAKVESMDAGMGGGGLSVPSGEQEVVSTVTLSYELR